MKQFIEKQTAVEFEHVTNITCPEAAELYQYCTLHV